MRDSTIKALIFAAGGLIAAGSGLTAIAQRTGLADALFPPSQIEGGDVKPIPPAPPRTLAEAQMRLDRAAATFYDAKAVYSSSAMAAELTAIIAYLEPAGDAPTQLRDALVMLGMGEQRRENDQAAMAAYAKAFAIPGAAPQTAKRAAYDHHTYADLAKDKGQFALAVAQYRIALDNMGDAADFTENQRLGTTQDLAYVLHEAGRYEEALANNRIAIEGGEKLFGKDDPKLYSVVLNAAQNLHALGRKSEAEPYLSRALDIARREGSAMKEQDILFQFGVLSFELGRVADARRYMRERLALVQARAPKQVSRALEDLQILEDKIGLGGALSR